MLPITLMLLYNFPSTNKYKYFSTYLLLLKLPKVSRQILSNCELVIPNTMKEITVTVNTSERSWLIYLGKIETAQKIHYSKKI